MTLRAEAGALTKRWNLWLVDAIARMKRMAQQGYSTEELEGFTSEVAGKSADASREAHALDKRLLAYKRNHKIFRFFGVEDALGSTAWLGQRLG